MSRDISGQPTSHQTIKRIAICTVGELFGGIERHVLGIIRGLAAHGVSALLVLFHDEELAAQARALGVDPIILSNRNSSLLATSRQLARILEQHKIHVVHVHGYKATVFCALACRWHLFAMVKTEHGLPEPMTSKPMRMLKNSFYHFLDTKATRMTRATICYVTEDLCLHHAHAHAGLRVTVIPNGVANMDRGHFVRPQEFHQDRFNVAIVGRLDTVKGHHVAIEALSDVSMPPNVHLQIVGVGPSESPLRALSQQRGIANRVHLLGFRRNVYDYLAHCDALLMPSLHEGLPYTLLEAMALGIPIIASRVGGLAEVIQEDATGLLVPPNDAAALADAIRRLIADPFLRARLGDEAQRLQRARYSLEAMASSYLDVYREVFASNG